MLRLASDVEHEVGSPPLSDETLSRLTSPDVRHLVRPGDSDGLRGYAQLDAAGGLEIAATDGPAGAELIDAALALTEHPLVWSHGRRSPLVGVLETTGFTPVRELYQLRRAEAPLPPDPPLPEGVSVRAFEVGRDEDAWLAVNAAAFATHPEQGSWTRADLAAREDESWFDPAGFLLAERDGRLLGFHWTKVHPPVAGGAPLGEVYVLGADPSAQGLGLGSALLVRGLRRLADHGAGTVLLYVDGDNVGARRLYARDGFDEYDLDVQWRRTGGSGDPGGN